MNIFKDLILMDASSFPTGKELHLTTPAEVVAIEGEHADKCPWNALKFTHEGQDAYVRVDRWKYPVGTKVSEFIIKEFGTIGRRKDNKFHPEDAATSESKWWTLTTIIN